MAQVVIDCPFCHAQNMTMKISGVTSVEQSYPCLRLCFGMAFCTKCDNPVGLKFFWKRKKETEEDNTSYHLLNAIETADKIGVTYSLTTLPQKNNELPHLPAEVQKAFTQAEKNMHMAGCEEAAVMMYRRAIETAIDTRYKHNKNIMGKNLKEKIDKLEALHIIPKAMKDWAHEIRSIGNDGAHEVSGVTRADAEAAQAFTTAFL